MTNFKPDQKFKRDVDGFIDENRRTFSGSSRRIISDYQAETELRKAYDGRQLLEMLQNADDAGATDVSISLDRSESKLIFSNTGRPFTADGIGSLMISHLSSKRGQNKMIGNKGLGFRSVLNWAQKIEIRSKGYSISFSPEIASEEFIKAVPDVRKRSQLLRKNEYPPDFVPFPFLGIASIDPLTDGSNHWATMIAIDFIQETEDTIVQQLRNFKKEILIFLNNINRLTITIDGDTTVYSSHNHKLPAVRYGNLSIGINKVTIEGNQWVVYSLSNPLPEKYQNKSTRSFEYYNLRVALNDNLENDYFKLFNFFPTELSLNLPCLVHGTFELDPSRNQLTNASKNTFHFEQLTLLLAGVIEELKKKAVDWKPYRLISPLEEHSDDVRVKAFYESLREQKKILELYPCVDNTYRTIQDAVSHGYLFSEFITANKFASYFPALLKPFDDSLLRDDFLTRSAKCYNTDYFAGRIASVAGLIRTNKLLAHLIWILSDSSFRKSGKHNYSILVNNEREQIPADYTAFTPVSKNKEFDRPSYVKFDFINRGLYAELIGAFDLESATSPARELQHKLKDNFTIQPYEPAQVIITYINEANLVVKSGKSTLSRKVVIEMVKALYVVFNALGASGTAENSRVDDLIAAGVPLLNRNNKISNNIDLIFGKDYPDGRLANDLFRNILTLDNYLALPDKWELESEDRDDVQRFFKWLKVGSFSQLEKWTETGNDQVQGPYIKYVLTTIPKQPFMKAIHASGVRVKGLEQILKNVGKGISREQLLVWIIRDVKISEALNFSKDKFYYSYSGKDIPVKPTLNYIRWQFQRSRIFENYVIDERNSELVNPFYIDYADAVFRLNNIQPYEIERALVLLGAYQTFDDLPVNAVFKILDHARSNDVEANGKGTAALYLSAVKNFSQAKNRDAATKHSKVWLFAKKGDQRAYKPAGEIYYSDNHTLPQKVIDNQWVFVLSRRRGEVQVSDFFGTKTVEGLRPQVIQHSIKVNSRIQAELSEFMARARVFILAFRIESMKKSEDKQAAADLLEDMEIIAVDSCAYNIEANEQQYLNEGEFIEADRKFYFRVPAVSATFSKLKEQTAFRDAFAEIFSMLFKITDLKSEFRNIVALGLDDTRHLLEIEHDNGLLKEANDLLQVNANELSFWKRICKFLGHKVPANRGTKEQFMDELQTLFKIKLPSTYRQVDFEAFRDDLSVAFVGSIAKKIDVPAKICVPAGFYQYHFQKIVNAFDNYENAVEFRIWQSLKSDTKSQKTFIKSRDKYRTAKNDAARKLSQDVQFKTEVDYDKQVRNAIKNLTGFQLQKNEEVQQVVTSLYDRLKTKFEDEWYGLSNEFLSLSFYPGNGERLKAELLKKQQVIAQADDDSEDGPAPTPDTSPVPAGAMTFVQLSKSGQPIVLPLNRSSAQRSVFDIRLNKQFHHAGKDAEKLVRDQLIAVYGRANVRWVSGNSDEAMIDDNAGFDIKYRDGGTGDWILVEVKSAVNDSFVISAREVAIGILNKDRYQLALVKNGAVFMVKDFFKDENWARDFTIDSDFTAIPKDWIVNFLVVN